MKKILFVLLMLCPAVLFAQITGKVYDNLTLTSKILKSERKYAVYLPPDYETSGRTYPILYLLHGSGDDQTGWVQFGEVLSITDKALRDGMATPMIIVMPDGNTGHRGYFNRVKGDWNYEDFIFNELMPFVEKKYKVKSEKRYRAIAGLSMGGEGTFIYALHHPELFSSACPLSAATGFWSLDEAKSYCKEEYPAIKDSTISNYYKQYSVSELMKAMPDAKKKDVRWFMDVGDDDFLYEGNGLVHNLMRKLNIPHEYRVRDGAHNWTYWRASLPKVLEFVSQGFHQY
ncbi:alpha/beta hydrolase-fold protein [Mucilaginibacter sp. RB4R14]|uniref:alpha/beta hydrolase n=1 Tax=Mucilaginibacter aurantiaciroseus TaxID=2949308 RepID=UPI0020907AD0|nr:alpha/beta hydrolase-fold protein [Mucilaginibacter aurantiaciroseus]MCO5935827.1 alpha/beta hydrolase-fold protein [Mucilaginibacter aurantiaciroseus]